MKKTMKYNSRAIMNLDTLLGVIQTPYLMWNDRPEKLEESLKSNISTYNEIQNRYSSTFNNAKFVAELPVDYIKHILSNLSKLIKEISKYDQPWFIKSYIDFVKNNFTELMLIYKKGGWDKQ